MAASIRLRDDYTGDDLRALARSASNGKQTRRLLALSLIAMGVAPVSDAAPITLLPLFIAL